MPRDSARAAAAAPSATTPRAAAVRAVGDTETLPTFTPATPAQAATLAPPVPDKIARQTGALEQASLAALPAGAGRNAVMTNCLICHAATLIAQQRKDSTAWMKTIIQMRLWGAPITAADQPSLAAYLATVSAHNALSLRSQ